MSNQTMNEVSLGCGCAACHSAANSTQSEYGENNSYNGTVERDEASATDLQQGSAWGTTNLNYKFLTSVPTYYTSGDKERSGFEAFNSQMQDATIRILDHLETFTNLDFSETSNANQNNTLTFAQTTHTSGVGAYAYYPTSHLKGGDVWTNNRYSNTQDPTEGNYAFYTLMHELGHALGLQHSFEVYSGDEATSQYSVMAYDWSYGFSETFQLYDIAALQDLYGANTAHNAGDDIYVLKTDAKYTIWDAGGIDTFDASHVNTNVILDLTEGAFSSVGLSENIAIAYGATIENATGGSGGDVLAGNDADNILMGNAGDDTFYESLGDDTFDGGAGSDKAIFTYDLSDYLVQIINSVTISLQYIPSNAITTLIDIENFVFDAVSYTFNELDILFGKEEVMGTLWEDFINGSWNPENILGLDGDDKIHAGAGNDNVSGDGGNDRIYGNSGDDYIYGDNGNDVLLGNDGNDNIFGGAGNDILNGGIGDDILDGGAGDNKLYGGAGDDIAVFEYDLSDYTIQIKNSVTVSLQYTLDNTITTSMDIENFVFNNVNYTFDQLEQFYNQANNLTNQRIGGNAGDDNISGGGGNDVIIGNQGDDNLVGGAGDDVLNGGVGNDVLNGGSGKNKLYGGSGDDIFMIDGSADGGSTIMDFKIGEDRIDISDLLSDYNPTTDDINDFVSIVELWSGNLNLAIDADGQGNAQSPEIAARVIGFEGLTVQNLDDAGAFII